MIIHDAFRKYITSKIELIEADWNLIKEAFIPIKVKKRQFLLREGEQNIHLWFVINGSMRMYKEDGKGNEHIIQFAFDDYWIGDRESSLSKLPSKYNIDAIEDSTVLQVTIDQLENLYQRIPHFKEMHAQLQVKNFAKVQERIHKTLSYSAEEKYNDILQHQPIILQRVPLSMVASYLGISRETLSRIRAQQGKKP